MKQQFLTWIGVAVLALGVGKGALAQCGLPGTPASVVPQFRPETGGESIWPLGVDGAPLLRPASEIPADRDSTDYITQTIPGASSGHELFQDVAVAPGAEEWLFVAYNAGLQVWGLSDPAVPVKRLYRDGWQGGIHFFPSPGEGDTYITRIDALRWSVTGEVWLALAGPAGHGLSVWLFDPVSESLEQVFQEAGAGFLDVRLVEQGGRVFALGSDKSGSGGGLHVYDLLGLTLFPCFDDVGGADGCSAYVGDVGEDGDGGWFTDTDGSYVDAAFWGGQLYVVTSDGSSKVTDPLAVELWRVGNLASPAAAPSGSAVQVFQGLGGNSRGVRLLEVAGQLYLAVLRVVGAEEVYLEVFELGGCLSAGSCSSLGSPVASRALRPVSGNFQFLTVSRSGDRRFLYYGLETSLLLGAAVEQLLEVLPSEVGLALVDLTESGARYLDACSGEMVGYWGDYYSGNAYGLDNLIARRGVVVGEHFYRAAVGVLDIHQIGESSSAGALETRAGSVESWLGEAVLFSAEASGACEPSEGSWCWLVEAPSEMAYQPIPEDPVSGCDPALTDSEVFSFSCAEEACGLGTARVMAANLGCSEETVLSGAAITLQDPRLRWAGAELPFGALECSSIEVAAQARGRGPFSYAVLQDGAMSCSGFVAFENFDGARLECGISVPELKLLVDGFETGDCSRWSSASPDSCGAGTSSQQHVELEWRIWTSLESAELEGALVIVPASEPSWLGEVAVEVMADLVRLRAPGASVSQWLWEIEGDGPAECSFGGQTEVSCFKEETAVEELELVLSAGVHRYRVSAGNCRHPEALVAEGAFEVEELPVQPDVLTFILDAETPCCLESIVGPWACEQGEQIDFLVQVEPGTGEFLFEVDWFRSTLVSAPSFVPVAATGLGGGLFRIERAFSSPSLSYPILKASSGSLEDVHSFMAGPSGLGLLALEVAAGACP